MRKITNLAFIGVLCMIVLVHCEEQNEASVPEALQDLQTTRHASTARPNRIVKVQ